LLIGVLQRLIGETCFSKEKGGKENHVAEKEAERSSTRTVGSAKTAASASNPTAYRRFLGHNVTVGDVYQHMLMHGPEIVHAVIEQLKHEEESKNTITRVSRFRQSQRGGIHHSASGTYGEIENILQAKSGFEGYDYEMAYQNKEYNEEFTYYVSRIRVGRNHRQKLIQSQSIYRSLGLAKGSHRHVLLPKYESTSLTVSIQKLDNLPFAEILTYCRCTIIKEDGNMDVRLSTEDVLCTECPGKYNAQELEIKTKGYEGLPAHWQCAVCGFSNLVGNAKCAGGMMTWNCDMSFKNGEFTDGDALEFTLWQDRRVKTSWTSGYRRKRALHGRYV
jgi:hypothetical protein